MAKDRNACLDVRVANARRRISWVKTVKTNWHKAYFIVALGAGLFLYGVLVGAYDVFPHRILADARTAAADWLTNYKQYARIRPEKFIRPARHSGTGVTVYQPRKVYKGVTFITSMWEKTNGMQLIAMDGTVLHKWRVSISRIFPNATLPDSDKRISDWDTVIHGALLYTNGDVVFNFEHEGLVKVDKCSNVLWKLPLATHHSIYEDTDGNLWVPAEKFLREPQKRLPLLEPPIHEDYILKVSFDGRILEQTSVLDVFYNSKREAYLFANGTFLVKRTAGDILHTNSIKILEKSIAAKFPLFKTGDILVSMRNLNLLIVIDGSSKKIKWSMTGPFIRQHDPAFLDNGRIAVYDNRSDDADGKVFGGSRILSIDPVTKQVDTLYTEGRESFFTNIAGKQQHLPNGNILISEYDAGRVFEVTGSGELVWSYINRYDSDEVYVVTGGTRYPVTYEKFAEAASCQ
jgi:arylsulfotransferase ASST